MSDKSKGESHSFMDHFVRRVDDEENNESQGEVASPKKQSNQDMPVFGARSGRSAASARASAAPTFSSRNAGANASDKGIEKVRSLLDEDAYPALDQFHARLQSLAGVISDMATRYQAALATVDGHSAEDVLGAYDSRLKRLGELREELKSSTQQKIGDAKSDSEREQDAAKLQLVNIRAQISKLENQLNELRAQEVGIENDLNSKQGELDQEIANIAAKADGMNAAFDQVEKEEQEQRDAVAHHINSR